MQPRIQGLFFAPPPQQRWRSKEKTLGTRLTQMAREGVAQWLERLTGHQKVADSIPVWDSNRYSEV